MSDNRILTQLVILLIAATHYSVVAQPRSSMALWVCLEASAFAGILWSRLKQPRAVTRR